MAAVRRILTWLSGRGGAVLLVLIGWTVLIGVGAGSAPTGTRRVGLPPLQWVVFAFTGSVALVGALLLIASLFFRRHGESAPPPKRSWWPIIILVLLVLALGLREPPDDDVDPNAVSVTVEEPDGSGDGGRAGVIDGRELGALILILGASLAILVWTGRRVTALEVPANDQVRSIESDLGSALGRAADRLSLGTDPRSSVLIAYAGLEETLAARDRPRHAFETPAEHLDRVLADLSIDAEPLFRLARLYEIARFSDHAITVTDQHAAARSLAQVRDDLAANA